MTPRVDHIAGETYHGRRGETKNAFRYSIDYVLLDAETAPDAPALFARNAGNLMSLHDADHGGPPKQGRGAVAMLLITSVNQSSVSGALG